MDGFTIAKFQLCSSLKNKTDFQAKLKKVEEVARRRAGYFQEKVQKLQRKHQSALNDQEIFEEKYKSLDRYLFLVVKEKNDLKEELEGYKAAAVEEVENLDEITTNRDETIVD